MYDSIDDNVTTVRYQDVLLGRDRRPLIIPREHLDVVLVEGGGLSFQLHFDFEEIIENALTFDEPEEEPEEAVDQELEELDSEALREHTLRQRQQQRTSFSEQVLQVTGRQGRTRQPRRDLWDYYQ